MNGTNGTHKPKTEKIEVPSDRSENEHIIAKEQSLLSNYKDKPLIVISPDFCNTQELDQKLEEYFYKDQDGLFKCCQCGKECMKRTHILEHVEIHVDNLSFPCQFEFCDKTFRSRNARKSHIWRHNKQC